MWAHQMKKHSSFDEPPNKRFWKSVSSTAGCDEGATRSVNVTSLLTSPGKRVNLRGQCIYQLLRLQQLFEQGGVSQEQYSEMKEAIMNDVKKIIMIV